MVTPVVDDRKDIRLKNCISYPLMEINLKACTLSSMTFFFRSDQELNSSPSGCHVPHALVGVLDHRATRTGYVLSIHSFINFQPFSCLRTWRDGVKHDVWRWRVSGNQLTQVCLGLSFISLCISLPLE